MRLGLERTKFQHHEFSPPLPFINLHGCNLCTFGACNFVVHALVPQEATGASPLLRAGGHSTCSAPEVREVVHIPLLASIRLCPHVALRADDALQVLLLLGFFPHHVQTLDLLPELFLIFQEAMPAIECCRVL